MFLVAGLERCERALASGRCIFAIARIATLVILFLLALPLLLGFAFGVPPLVIVTLIASTLAFQAIAAVIGLGFGLHPAIVLALLTSVAVGVMIGILELCYLFGGRFRLLQRLIQTTNARAGRVAFLGRYGALMLIPTIWFPGIALYGTPVVAWLFQYPRFSSLLCMTAGWAIAVVTVMAAASWLVRPAF